MMLMVMIMIMTMNMKINNNNNNKNPHSLRPYHESLYILSHGGDTNRISDNFTSGMAFGRSQYLLARNTVSVSENTTTQIRRMGCSSSPHHHGT